MSQEFPDPLAMSRALEVARRGLGRVSPNPPVGAVLVAGTDAERRAEGWHQFHGGNHAEVNCLEAAREAGIDPRGADLYVTLEPCAHHGKTPPCVEAIIDAGIARVVVSADDPNPITSGKGYEQLSAAGIEVVRGFLAEDGKWLIAGYLCHVRNSRPLVTAKWAMTADGRIACAGGDSHWITCEETRAATRAARSEVDAILVGVGTVISDDPQLTSRTAERPEPLRVVIDPRCRTPENARLFQESTPVLIYCGAETETTAEAEVLRSCGAEVVAIKGTAGVISIPEILADLATRGVQDLLVEGGADTHGRFLDADLVDRVQILVAPKVVGGRTAPGPIGGEGISRMECAHEIRACRWRELGPDRVLEGAISAAGSGDEVGTKTTSQRG
ncbi:MAG: bifunctional diaminohydroxyphosphoribosylaminopyrimidine deaminase/5-amino-6-(5-phosphoribosylamino)uracil reductase RibD [Planctomycetota bacterium]|nr:bifunctional diaminohydroxyphosphoribosylaminopyrimidine deaminase/5-amino-6-(5-phosphoribosylamino)uracil reductase RibD [Planctomycetota bacterium]